MCVEAHLDNGLNSSAQHLYEIGMAREVTPVIGVLANPICKARGLPWTELAGRGAF